MNLVTVDFSLNSPGICVWQSDTNEYHFISYIKAGSGTKAEQRRQEEISTFTNLTVNGDITVTGTVDGRAKIKRYIKTADDIINLIVNITQTKQDYHIAFEGTSYGSKMGTNNMIDMAAGAAILKEQMISQLEVKNLLTVAPTTIKKHAGKGNMNKLALWVAFLNNIVESPELAKTSLFKYCVNDIGDEVKKVPKPFDDLVDAWFLNHYLLQQLGENLPD